MGKTEPLPPTHADGEGGPEEEGEKTGSANCRRRKRDLFPRHLPVIISEVIVPEEVEADPAAFTKIGERHHDEIEALRAAIFWDRTVREKYKRIDDRS